MKSHVNILYFIATLLIVWGVARIVRRLWKKSGRLSRAERVQIDKDYQSAFQKCPYWIKVFLKTVQDKNTAYSDANSYHFENYSQFLLQFVDYKTVSDSTWQYSMRDEAKKYFEAHPQLLADVTEEEIRRHARRTDERIVAHMSTELYWWYYSDDDYIEPIAWSDSSNPFMLH